MNSDSISVQKFQEQESFFSSHQDGPKRDKGRLFLALDIADNPGAEDSIAEKTWRALHDSYYNCSSDDQYLCFEEALKRANEVLMKEGAKRAEGTLGRVHAVATLEHEGILHFSQMGTASLYLKRAGRFSPISEDSTGDQEFLSIASGDLVPGDLLLMSTRPLPLHQPELIDAFEQKQSKWNGALKSWAKKQQHIGMLSYFSLEEEATATDLAPELIEEAPKSMEKTASKTPESPELPLENLDEEEEQPGPRAKLTKLMNSVKAQPFDKVIKAFKGMGSGIGSKAGKLVRKPDSITDINKRYVLLGIVGVLVLFMVLFTLSSNYRQKAEIAADFEQKLSNAESSISIAENRFLIGEKSDATEKLNEAERILTEIQTAGFYQTEVSQLLEEVTLHRDNFDAIIRVESPTIYADLTEKGTVDALGLINTQDQKNFVYEPRRLFETLLNKVQEPLTIDQEEIVVAGAELEDFNVISFITQSGQVIEYETRNGRFQLANTQDETWNKGIDVKTFNGEFLYILDSQANSIWKYRRLRNSYSTASVYSSQGDLTTGISMAIDGDIYVLLRNGDVLKYSRGDQVNLELRDKPTEDLQNPTKIFTLPEHNNFYILDSGLSRIIVYAKGQSGIATFQKQLVFPELAANSIKDFTVDLDEQKVTFVTADKVYISDL